MPLESPNGAYDLNLRYDASMNSTQALSDKKIFAVAPMMEWTDRHCRVLHRFLSTNARLYTEMLTAEAILRGDRERLLRFSDIEHPVALQLGGSDPERLAEASRIGEDFGYDEINLNVGCPSDRVQSGRFGACLMEEPQHVGECVSAMVEAVKIPITVKCRIGVDQQDPETAPACFGRGLRECGDHKLCSPRAQGHALPSFAETKPRCPAFELSACL